MEAYLSKACWRAGAKLVAGFAVVGAIVGIRIVTATPTGIEGEIAELERFEAEQAELAAGGMAGSDPASGAPSLVARGGSDQSGSATPVAASASRPERATAGATDSTDLDRMVRCDFAGQSQFMRAADCATRGGGLEELPPPEPEDAIAAPTAP